MVSSMRLLLPPCHDYDNLDLLSLAVWDAASGAALPFVRTPLPAAVGPQQQRVLAVAVPLPASHMAILAGGPPFDSRQWHISLPGTPRVKEP